MLQENVNLKNFNTFGIGVNARFFSNFYSIEELQHLLKESKGKPILILGGGSNVLFKDDFEGIVLRNKIQGIEIVKENTKEIILKSGAGEVWHQLVLYTLDKGWGGLENLSLIPGCVGASPMQNIGAYGAEIKDVFVSLEAVDIGSGELRIFSPSECNFGYRESVFKNKLKNKYIITSVSYRLSKQSEVNTKYGAIEEELRLRNISSPTIKEVSNAVISIRQSKLPDPKEIGNAGSFFKNPILPQQELEILQKTYPTIPFYSINDHKVKVPAGWLIEQAGWKGKTFGSYGVHKNQALVLVNYGGSKGREIYDLSSKIIADIKAKYGIQLEREVNIM